MSRRDRTPLVLDDDGRDPWKRQSRETPAQFEMFQRYADMPDRSAAALAEELGRSVAYITQCAWAGRWKDRAEQRDLAEVEKRAARNAREREVMNDQHLALARRMLAKAAVGVQGLDPAVLKPNEIARLVEVAAKMQRTALDMPAATVAVTGQGGGPVSLAVVPQSEADRVARLGEISAELARRAGRGDVDPAAFDLYLDDTAAG